MYKPIIVILTVVIVMLLIAIGLAIGPIPQPESYHHFADKRSFFGIPNAWNVLSNLSFALAGFWGIFILLKSNQVQFLDSRERWPWLGFSVGLLFTAIGSAYYHWASDNASLVWDRLPMTILFASFVAALITERLNVSIGIILWPILMLLGFYSVYYWFSSEQHGMGDLRLYGGIQIFTAIFALVMMVAPSPYNRNYDILVALFLFGISRIFEIYDHQIADMTNHQISGHTLKHFTSALAGFWLLRMVWKRKIVHQAMRRK